MTKEDIMQSHVQSILRLDSKIQKSTVAQKSIARHSSKMKQQQKVIANSKTNAAGVSNSRGSASAFSKKEHKATYDKAKDRQKREEDYYVGVAKALTQARKDKK